VQPYGPWVHCRKRPLSEHTPLSRCTTRTMSRSAATKLSPLNSIPYGWSASDNTYTCPRRNAPPQSATCAMQTTGGHSSPRVTSYRHHARARPPSCALRRRRVGIPTPHVTFELRLASQVDEALHEHVRDGVHFAQQHLRVQHHVRLQHVPAAALACVSGTGGWATRLRRRRGCVRCWSRHCNPARRRRAGGEA
jgi:hypothetical protein